MRRIILGLLIALGAIQARAATYPVDIGSGVVCTLETRLVGCTTTGGTPIPTPVITPGPAVTPAGCLTLSHQFERQPTLLGYDRLRVDGRAVYRFCATPILPSGRNGGKLGAAWQDNAFECTSLRIRLVSFNGTRMAGATTNWTGTPSLPYKFLFGGVAPAGEYFFEVEADSRTCTDGKGSFMVLWTP